MLSYALTVTLKPKFRKVKGQEMLAPDQYDKTYERICNLLNGVNVSEYTVIAELTKAGDIHYHGMIYSDDDYKGLQYNLACSIKQQEVFGFFVLKEITDKEGWITYMSKNIIDTHTLVGRPPVIRDDNNIIRADKIFKAVPL